MLTLCREEFSILFYCFAQLQFRSTPFSLKTYDALHSDNPNAIMCDCVCRRKIMTIIILPIILLFFCSLHSFQMNLWIIASIKFALGTKPMRINANEIQLRRVRTRRSRWFVISRQHHVSACILSLLCDLTHKFEFVSDQSNPYRGYGFHIAQHECAVFYCCGVRSLTVDTHRISINSQRQFRTGIWVVRWSNVITSVGHIWME